MLSGNSSVVRLFGAWNPGTTRPVAGSLTSKASIAFVSPQSGHSPLNTAVEFEPRLYLYPGMKRRSVSGEKCSRESPHDGSTGRKGEDVEDGIDW
jgi:hypothetical protein